MEERAEQVRAVAAWLARGRGLLMVVGEPGAGKTAVLEATMPSTSVRCCARYADKGVPLGSVRTVLATLGIAQPAELRDLTARPCGPDVERRFADAGASLRAALAPHLVVLDDAHWADAASLRVLGRAVRGADRPVLAVGTRPWNAEHHPGVADLVRVAGPVGPVGPVTVTVPPLTPTGVRRMLGRLDPGRSWSDEDVAEFHRRTGGLPLLVEAVVGSGTVPDGKADLAAYVAHELAGLGQDAVRVARAVAVLGGTGSLADVAAVSDTDPADVADLLDAIAAAGLLGSGPTPRIRHPLLEELVAAHGGPGAARSAYARAARRAHATGGDADRLTGFLMCSWPLGERWATEALLDSARAARSTADARLARTLVERARAERADDTDTRSELGTIEAWTALQLEPAPAALVRVEEIIAAQERSGARDWADRTRSELVEFAMLAGDLDLARAQARALVVADDGCDDLGRHARGLRAFLGASFLAPGAEPERLSVLRGADRLLASERVDALPVLAHAAVTFATAGLDAEATGAVERLRGVRFEQHPRMLVELGLAGVALVQLERLDDAAEVFAAVGGAATLHRIDDVAANARTWAARIAGWRGDAGAARTAADELDAGRVWPVLRPVAAAAVLDAALLDGTDAELEEALAAARSELAVSAVPHGPGMADLLLGCARAEHALGRPAAAAELVARAAVAYPVGDWLAPWPLVALHVDGGPALTRRAAPVVRRWTSLARPVTGGLATSWPTPWTGVEPPSPDPAGTSFPLGIELLLLQGRTLRRAGRHGAARPVLHRSLATALAAGHHRMAAAARAELHLAGGRAGSQARPYGLTPAEQRVAVLAADGRSNRDISEVLVVSVKTVESHMTRLLAKTGRRRDDLAVVVAEIRRSSPAGHDARASGTG
ncbi:helix-turn-helix transcriptional regulator [Nocardioides humi]|uniref:helix-turn-helix transcriptional regulator n=1 Tax=Nocardioides humi TaxID=449461 RepID=UPI0015E830A5|nr:AAA family ATPase [Nocardioides humi]